jgi:hypothetical protein
MIEVIPVLTDTGGNLPRYGDGDDGMAVQLQAMGDRRDAWLFDFGRVLLGADVPSSEQSSLPERLAGLALVPPGEQKTPSAIGAFEDAGLYVLSSARGTPQETFVLFDAGPQGYSSLAAHGHADALSFTLSIGGRPVFVDPGTYCYHAEPDWRAYFRGTRAHNTVTVDGQDQAVAGGTFIWLKKADARVLEWNPGKATIVAEHAGYGRLRAGVVHRRKIVLENDQLELTDELLGAGEHELEWRFHFAPECTASLSGNDCLMTWEGGSLRMELDARIQWALHRAEHDSGWFSPTFGIKLPTQTLCGSWKGVLPQNAVVIKCRK